MSLFGNIILSGSLFLGMVLLQGVGFRMGRSGKLAGWTRLGVGFIEAAVFGFLGLLLAFQFNRAATQLDTWRSLIVREGNAIATSYRRLELLSPERRPALQELFRRYADARIRYYEGLASLASAPQDTVAAGLQPEIWSRAAAAVRQEPSSATANLLLSSVNEMFDVAEARKVAGQTHIPPPVVFLPLSMALLSALLAGYAMSSSDKGQNWLHVLVFAAVVGITIFVALDMEYPRSGLIRVGAADQALVDARRGMD